MESNENVNAFVFSFKDDKEINEFFGEDIDQSNDIEQMPSQVSDQPSSEVELQKQTDIKDEDLDQASKTNFSKRMFGKIEAGSIRGSIFNMVILSLGTGCLSLPKSMGDMSLIMGLISIIFTGCASYYTLSIVTSTSEKFQIFNYSKLTRKLFGNIVGFILDLSVLIYIIGILILYQVVIYKTLGEVIYNLGGFYNDIEQWENMNEFIQESFWSSTYVNLSVMSGITLFIIFPLCLVKDVSRLRMASLLGVLTLVFLIILIVIQCPFYIKYYWDNVYKEDDPKTHLNIFNVSSGFDSNLFFFQGTSTLFYAYTCHLGAFPIFNTLKNRVSRRIQKVITRTIILDSVFFIIISICGYLTWPYKTPDLIIGRENIAGGADIIMSIGRIALITILIMKLPNTYNSFRISFLEMVFGDSNVTNKRNLLITIPTLSLTVFIAVLYNHVLGIIKILGGFCSTFLGFIMPGLIYIKSNEYSLFHWKNIMTFLLILSIGIIGYTSGIITLVDIINGKGH